MGLPHELALSQSYQQSTSSTVPMQEKNPKKCMIVQNKSTANKLMNTYWSFMNVVALLLNNGRPSAAGAALQPES